MKVGLFIPCYIDQMYPRVGKDTLELLEKAGCEVVFLEDILCCGQPMANSGYERYTQDSHYEQPFLDALPGLDYLVVPSASCAYHLRHHLLKSKIGTLELSKIKEITEFLHDTDGLTVFKSNYPHKVGLHQSCHGLRGLELAKASELEGPHFSKLENLLSRVAGLDLVIPPKSDECCGFGGSFAIDQGAVSVKMGEDKMKNIISVELEYLTATDMSCLMHLEGVFHKNNAAIKVLHITEILNSEG